MNKYKFMFMLLSMASLWKSLILFKNKIMILLFWKFLSINSMKMEFSLYMDWMSFLFISTIMLISSMIMMYSINYMNNDKMMNTFTYILILFILSMICMIISPNLMSIILGWDGLGLTSFCLIMYYNNNQSMNSSLITILTNRLGDILILINISMLTMLGSWNFFIFKYENMYISIMLIITALTKSAQFPFSSWLPAAMAAPTPVSSLVHSSTLVTAGIYLLIRYMNIMNHKWIKLILLISASLTLLMSSILANMENDLKKIIALSTLSQLSIMMISLTSNLKMLSFFHLISHATFKSLLFMCSGTFIHNSNLTQNIRNFGNMILFTPFISSCFMIATLSLCGFMFMSGFFSKDWIYETTIYSKNNLINSLILLISIGLTISYSSRLLIMMFMNKSSHKNYLMKNFLDSKMNLSLIMLTVLSIIMSFLMSNLYFYSQQITMNSILEKSMILLISMMSIFLGKFIYNNTFHNFFILKYFFFLNSMIKMFIKMTLKTIYEMFKFEKMINEMMINLEVMNLNQFTLKFNKNIINEYKLFMMMILFLSIILMLYKF
uniref:NADH-ubiquinone oxidoreductase chain 5 n=1 Tax=Orthogonalys pulchella TaxID=32427 RepID=A0A096XMY5_9HYME|nr:NADH dehydrogenase subunit 5 [Orthogonalys pulchella]AIC37442.1 NADH dehydrogenase subunit 5 [Orthogonalys pulchella]